MKDGGVPVLLGDKLRVEGVLKRWKENSGGWVGFVVQWRARKITISQWVGG